MDTDAWRDRIRALADERGWPPMHDPRGLAMALSVEVAELVEVLHSMTVDESRRIMSGERRQDVEDEVADVMAHVLRLVDALGIDLDAAMESRTGRHVDVPVPVLGVDACKAGWVGVVLEPDAPRPRVVMAPSVHVLVELVRESLGLAVVGIDIPIGLPDRSLRRADSLARAALKGKASSVFTTLTRDAYATATRVEADAVNRERSGQGVGAQAYALREKILEVDAWVRSRPTVTVIEVHPEVSFAAMTGAPILTGKKTDEGAPPGSTR